MNPQMLALFQKIKGSSNPQQFVYNLVQERANTNDPFAQNLLNIMNSPNPEQGVKEFAQNFFKEQGADFNSSFNTFQNNLRMFLGK